MIRNYLKTAWRNTWAQRQYTVLSMLGLSLGLAVFISVLVYVNRENSYDRWHPQLDNVYRVITEGEWGGDYELTPFSPAALGRYMEEQLPEVASSTTFRELGETVVKVGEEEFYDRQILAVDSNFFTVFPYDFLYGNVLSALDQPNQAVLSREISDKWFGKSDPIGQVLEINKKTYTVSGVFQKVGPSHLDIHVCLSHNFDYSNWNVRVFNNYVLLKPNVSIQAVEQKAEEAFIYNFALGQQANPYFSNSGSSESISNVGEATVWLDQFFGGKDIQISLEKITNIHLKPKTFGWRDAPANHPVLDFEEGNHMPVIIFSIIGLLVLLLASFNYMNIAIAIGNDKAKDAGLRKIIGASKKQLALLSLAGSLMQVLIALMTAVLFSYFVVAYLNQTFGMELELWSTINPKANRQLVLQLIFVAIMMTLLTGLYPAFVLSSFKPIQLLKGELKQGQKGIRLRNGLITLQFVVAITFIASLVIMRSQLNYMQNNDPGFVDEQVLRINGNRVPMDFFVSLDEHASLMNSLRELPEVETISSTHFYPGQAAHSLQSVRFGGESDTLSVRANWVGLGYFETLGVNVIQGRSFSTDYATDTVNAAVINKTAALKMGLQYPIGERVSALGMEYRIIGVVDDIHMAGYQEAIDPELYVIGTVPGLTGGRRQLLVKFHDGRAGQQALDKIKEIWSKVDNYGPMRYAWLKDDYANLLRKYQTLDQLMGILTVVAVLIAIMGVFALSAFVAQQRTKEIGIRKVLGASISGIVAMLSKDFVKLVLIAIVVASPIAWWAMNTWLEDFAYRIEIQWWMFALAGLAALLIAVVTVSGEAIRAAMANPVDSLRDE